MGLIALITSTGKVIALEALIFIDLASLLTF